MDAKLLRMMRLRLSVAGQRLRWAHRMLLRRNTEVVDGRFNRKQSYFHLTREGSGTCLKLGFEGPKFAIERLHVTSANLFELPKLGESFGMSSKRSLG